MSSLWTQLSPTVTNLIRLDHSHVNAAFHQYPLGGSARIRRGLADNVCLALELHTQLEEEIFYPALRAVADTEVLRESPAAHHEMRALVSALRGLDPTALGFDDAFLALMRHVMHHVADEEATLLPMAERLLPEQLHELGVRMNKRRLELAAPRGREMVGSVARSVGPGTVLAAASAVLAGGYLLSRHQPFTTTWTRRSAGTPPLR